MSVHCPVEILKTSVLQIRTPFSNVNFLVDNFSENVYVSESKFIRVVFELFNFDLCVLKLWVHDDGFVWYGGYGGLKIVVININLSI